MVSARPSGVWALEVEVVVMAAPSRLPLCGCALSGVPVTMTARLSVRPR